MRYTLRKERWLKGQEEQRLQAEKKSGTTEGRQLPRHKVKKQRGEKI